MRLWHQDDTPHGRSIEMDAMLAQQTVAGPARPAAAYAGKYLTFTLGGEEYGLPVVKVREIIKLMDITQVPQVPPYVLGVINLRGKVIPVIDLRRKFGLPVGESTAQTCIIVAEVELATRRVMTGVVVDSVSEVLNVAAAEIDEPPEFGGQADVDYLLGLAKVKGSVKILLDLDRVLGRNGHVVLPAL
jgi:purine-binding chemotaxis protein CheW